MPTYVRDIARQVVSAIGLSSGYELAGQWVGQRYRELAGRAQFRHLRQYGQIYLPAPLTTGTVTITQDSPTITADATALTSWQTNKFYQYPDGFSGLWFRPQLGQTWYRILGVVGSTITVETPVSADNSQLFATGSPVSGTPYYILPRYLQLATDARQLGTFVADFMYRPLEVISEDQMNLYYSNRFLIWSYPQKVALLNNNLNRQGTPRQVEIYPWPSTSTTMHYTYWQTPPVLNLDSEIPSVIDDDILREGAIIDAMRQEMGKALRAGNLEAAATWRNEYRMQQGRWDGMVGRAIRNDRGVDDLKFLVQRNWNRMGSNNLDWDPIQTAYQNFLARGV